MTDWDPDALAVRQIELDGGRSCHFPQVLARKRQRMLASPLAFLRGSARLFYEMLGARADLRSGPAGEGFLVGDAHLENFGAFTPERHAGAPLEKRAAVFDLNDFDEAVEGPFHWDVTRLTTSLVLGSRELGTDGPRVLALSRALLDSYVHTAFLGDPVPAAPRPVLELIHQAQKRSRKELLDDRTELHGGRRRFRLGERYIGLDPEWREQTKEALANYSALLAEGTRPTAAELELVDVAFRVAGTGSLGALRLAALVVGKDDTKDDGLVFDLKEHLPASAVLAGAAQRSVDAARAVEICRACLGDPPRQLGVTSIVTLAGEVKDSIVRRLTPQEDKLELGRLKKSDLEPLAAYLGSLLGRAHARGAKFVGKALPAPWSRTEQNELLDRAVTLAGVHEATYLRFCWRAG